MLALPTSSGGGELIPQNERELRRSEGSGMLIDDPLGEGSKASSTASSGGGTHSQNERKLRRSEGSGML